MNSINLCFVGIVVNNNLFVRLFPLVHWLVVLVVLFLHLVALVVLFFLIVLVGLVQMQL